MGGGGVIIGLIEVVFSGLIGLECVFHCLKIRNAIKMSDFESNEDLVMAVEKRAKDLVLRLGFDLAASFQLAWPLRGAVLTLDFIGHNSYAKYEGEGVASDVLEREADNILNVLCKEFPSLDLRESRGYSAPSEYNYRMVFDMPCRVSRSI